MGGWKPISISLALILSAFLGLGTMYGTDVVVGTTVSGHISVDTTWDLARSPYIVMNDVVVDPGITLTIEPGVHVKFDPPGTHDYLNIFVEGYLMSVGKTNMTINFTSNAPTPSYDWNYVQINSTGIAYIENCSFSFGEGLVLSSTASHKVSNSIFPHTAKIITRSPGHYITNNSFYDGSGIALVSENNTVTNNSLFGSSIWLDVGNNMVSSNIVSQGWGGILPGIIVDTDFNTIFNNTMTDIIAEAVRVRGSYNVVSENSIESCGSGIEFGVSFNNNTALHNEITECGNGISILNNDENKVLYNTVRGGSYGILMAASDKNQVIGNEVSRASAIGIWVRSSAGNEVYHNIISDNAIQAQDDLDMNSWHNGYPSGGNYWSDYLGSDSLQGPNQNVPGSDGIGDTPYPVNPNGTDRYPLTEPTIGELPPRDVDAWLSGDDFENVTVSWNLSWNDGQRANDVTRYETYRSLTYNKDRSGYVLIGTTPNLTTEFVDSYSGKGDSNNYFYYVCAVNGTGNFSCSINQVGKFTRQLSEGENLVSIPLVQSDERLATVLQTVPFDKAWSYNSRTLQWESFAKSKPYTKGLEHVNHTIGLWINVTAGSDFAVAGSLSEETSIHLTLGWNLIGYPSFSPMTLAEFQQGIPISRAERFDPGMNPYHLSTMGGSDLLLPGEGYWVFCSSEWTITLEN